MKTHNIIFLLLFLFPFVVKSQEVLTPAQSNPVLEKLHRAKNYKKNTAEIPTVYLPFLEDFSNYQGYPDSALWTDQYGYVNSQYALFPLTLGVVTLDALDNTGKLYVTDSKKSFPADTLTSCYIRLDSTQILSENLKPKDSLYFSFFYQPGGGTKKNVWDNLIGDRPEEGDSLILEFYNADNNVWVNVWSTGGMPLDTLTKRNNGRYFEFVNIPIVDEVYFNKHFRFRFRNLCSFGNPDNESMIGNSDMWHIDYIRLDKDRKLFDTTFQDLSYIYPTPSFLKNYQAMPARQFKADDVTTKFTQYLTNNSNEEKSCLSWYVIYDENKILVDSQTHGITNIKSFWKNGYQDDTSHANPSVKYKFSSLNPDKRTFYEILQILKEGVVGGALHEDKCPRNDTNRFIQHFKNYYAYDDGTAENGYGIADANGQFAYKFPLNTTDTITGVQIYFCRTLNNANDFPFSIVVWNDKGGKPGDIIYRQTDQKIQFADYVNKYVLYKFDEPIIVNGNIYVGWQQTNEALLNVGFDKNTDARGKMFYKVGGGDWGESFLKGSVMLRPVFGTIDSTMLAISDIKKPKFSCEVFPNPASTQINISIPENQNEKESFYVEIVNILGQKVLSTNYKSSIDISSMQKGIYIISIYNYNRSKVFTSKLFVQ